MWVVQSTFVYGRVDPLCGPPGKGFFSHFLKWGGPSSAKKLHRTRGHGHGSPWQLVDGDDSLEGQKIVEWVETGEKKKGSNLEMGVSLRRF